MSYDRLADIRTPFGCRENAKAGRYFTRALTLAAGERLYRDALFDHLLNSIDCSPNALGDAAKILAATPVSDPDYESMRRWLDHEKRLSNSLDGRAGRLFWVPTKIVARLGCFCR